MKRHEAQWLESAIKPQLPFLQYFLKLQKWHFFFMSWGTKQKTVLWNSAAVGRKIIYLTSQVKVFIWAWSFLLWCPNTALMLSPVFFIFWLFPWTLPHPQSQSPSSPPPFLNLAKRESNSCRQSLLFRCFIFHIIAMNLKAMCAPRLGSLDAFPHYPLPNGTCCRTPRRVATLLAARGKQCWDADGFSKRLLLHW